MNLPFLSLHFWFINGKKDILDIKPYLGKGIFQPELLRFMTPLKNNFTFLKLFIGKSRIRYKKEYVKDLWFISFIT